MSLRLHACSEQLAHIRHVSLLDCSRQLLLIYKSLATVASLPTPSPPQGDSAPIFALKPEPLPLSRRLALLRGSEDKPVHALRKAKTSVRKSRALKIALRDITTKDGVKATKVLHKLPISPGNAWKTIRKVYQSVSTSNSVVKEVIDNLTATQSTKESAYGGLPPKYTAAQIMEGVEQTIRGDNGPPAIDDTESPTLSKSPQSTDKQAIAAQVLRELKLARKTAIRAKAASMKVRKATSSERARAPGAREGKAGTATSSVSLRQAQVTTAIGPTSTAWPSESWQTGWGEDKLAPPSRHEPQDEVQSLPPTGTSTTAAQTTQADSSAAKKTSGRSKVGVRPNAPRRGPSTQTPTLSPDLPAHLVNDMVAEMDVDPVESITEGALAPGALVIERVEPPYEAKVPRLAHGLDRVLFNPTVHWLQDPHSRVYNFEPYLQKLPSPSEFAYDRLMPFIPAVHDEDLLSLANKHNKLYIGSTSGLTGVLSHIYWLISQWREIDTSILSQEFREEPRTFGAGSKIPVSVLLRYKDGRYAVDPDKTWDISGKASNILMYLGTLLEKLLTLDPETFCELMKANPEKMPGKFRKREAYHYSTTNKLLMRSQLDCHDSRLPGTGVFDIKTRGVLAIRHDRLNYVENSGYLIKTTHGLFESFEREYYDMIRSAFLKFSMQVRIGNMDGIFVAYHNTSQMFGFQYISLEEMDERLFGGSDMGDAAFRLSLQLLEAVLDEATACFPAQTLRMTFETKENADVMNVWVEPDEWDEMKQGPRPIVQLDVKTDSYLDDELVKRSVRFERIRPKGDSVQWSLNYRIFRSSRHPSVMSDAVKELECARQRQQMIMSMVLPNGIDEDEMLAKFDTMDVRDIISAREALSRDEASEEAEEMSQKEEEDASQTSSSKGLKFRKPSSLVRRLRKISLAGAAEKKKLDALESGKAKIVWRPTSTHGNPDRFDPSPDEAESDPAKQQDGIRAGDWWKLW